MKGQVFYQGIDPAASGLPDTIHSTNAEQPIIYLFQRFFYVVLRSTSIAKNVLFFIFKNRIHSRSILLRNANNDFMLQQFISL